jgi:microsomal dipeptidase-like Zn-dependent dipeptidase
MVDLHCHYPMHLLARAPRDVIKEMSRVRGRPRWLDRLRAAVVLVAARALNFTRWRGGWRVGLGGLERGGVQVLCSVLYDPFAEIDLDESYGARPEPGYYDDLLQQLGRVEDDLRRIDPHNRRHVIVRTKRDLDEALGSHKVGFVHCVEGGFHLGSTPKEVTAHVAELAERGVRYITLAHLFWRQVATNAPALPFLSDRAYDLVFHQPKDVGLTDLGVAAVEAMHEHRVLVDLSHMREKAIHQTLDLLDDLDRDREPGTPLTPVIASHVAFRLEPDGQAYNVTEATVKRIHERGGVVGIIFAQHQLDEGAEDVPAEGLDRSIEIIAQHVHAISEHGTMDCVGIGTDLDGFIKPTIAGVDKAADLKPFGEKLRNRFPDGDDADKILSGNALRVLRAVLPD